MLRLLEAQKRATVDELADLYGVSKVTIRNDLKWLEANGLATRTHGGAMPVRSNRTDLAFAAREQLNSAEKARIGAAAASLVRDGESIALDSSTTALQIARRLTDQKELTVITNGIRAAEELSIHSGVTVLLPGGILQPAHLSVVGSWGEAVLRQIHIQKAFIGGRGFTLEEGLTDVNNEEARLKQAIIATAKEVIAIIDHTKWGQIAFVTSCPIDRITMIITDEKAPRDMVAQARSRGIAVTLV